MKTVTYDESLYVLVPRVATPEMLSNLTGFEFPNKFDPANSSMRQTAWKMLLSDVVEPTGVNVDIYDQGFDVGLKRGLEAGLRTDPTEKAD